MTVINFFVASIPDTSDRPLQGEVIHASEMEDGGGFYNLLHGEFYTRYEPRELLGR